MYTKYTCQALSNTLTPPEYCWNIMPFKDYSIRSQLHICKINSLIFSTNTIFTRTLSLTKHYAVYRVYVILYLLDIVLSPFTIDYVLNDYVIYGKLHWVHSEKELCKNMLHGILDTPSLPISSLLFVFCISFQVEGWDIDHPTFFESD